jgi:hypothetical protein
MMTSAQLAALTTDQLRELNRLTATILKGRAREARFNFRVGDRVEFTGRSGGVVRGTVDNIGPRNVMVKADDGWTRWRVGPSLLRHVAAGTGA